ncbi:MAG: LuxR C-terminal-related transcriptional regulator [Psychrobacillus psychrotolerans]|uniref:LuxR C-terminal-related transcriptional regulator n=1 Tax=Psychrobacillus psychrotolerans TaxID=126156 RepID=UPI003BB0FE92
MLNITKLIIPKLSSQYIERFHLNALFKANSYKKVTILRAPAGYGKTTLLSAYLRKIPESVAWVALDEGDNDPIQFWTYLVKAINDAYQTMSEDTIVSLLQIPNQSLLKIGLYRLIEELTAYHHPITIVLDDYHFIQDQQIHDFLIQSIEYLPDNVHLYFKSRRAIPFPLAKWRVKQWVQELNLSDLKFNRQDTKLFLTQATNRTLSESHIQNIYDKTEGWISGLILTTLAYENENMTIVPYQSFTTEFLWQEIFHKLPLDIQDFLLKTSLLQELDPTLCNELTGRTDSAILLQQLVEDGLFTFQLPSTVITYRYHHLFKDALRNELAKRYDAPTTKQIVKKAVFTYYAKSELIQAIELAIKYKIYDVAVSFIDEHLLTLLSSVQPGKFIAWLRLLREVSSPLSYGVLISGFMNTVLTLQFKLAQELMDELEALHLAEKWMDDPQNEALTNLYIRTKAYYFVGLGDKLPYVLSLLQSQLSNEGKSSEWDSLDISYNNYEINLLRMGLASKGKLISSEDISKVTQLFRHTELNTLVVSPYIFAVGVAMLYELNEITEAEKELAIVINSGLQNYRPDLYVPMYILKAQMYIMHDQLLSAQAMLQQITEKVNEKHWKNTLKIMQAHCHLLNGELESAKFLLDITKSYEPFWRLTYTRFLLKSSLNEEALHTIIQVKTEAQQEGQLATLIEATVLEVICHDQMTNHDVAFKTLHDAFQLAATYGYIRTFLDEKGVLPIIERYFRNPSYVGNWNPLLQDHLAKLKECIPLLKGIKQVIEPLTPREKDILKLIIAGAKNREIANELDLSQGTVRVYISTIYSKLGVTSRVQALLLAQQNQGILT